jgi:EmrB/QacA subfamily drug resistance transporter
MLQKLSERRKTVTLTVACLATTMLMLDISVINTALSAISAGLSTNLDGLQWLIDAYTLPLAAVVLTAGSLADRFGRRPALLVGLVLFVGASTVCGISGSIGLLDAARAVQGVGAAILFAVSLALIGQVTPTRAARAKAMALYGATISGAFAIGPFIGGALTETLGWRAIFLVNVPIGLVAIALTLAAVPDSKDPLVRRIDWAGQVALITAMFGLVLGLLRGNTDGWGSPLVLVSLSAGVALLALFAVIEARVREPMLPLRLFRDPLFSGVQLSVFAMASSAFAAFLYISLYLQIVVGLGPLQTGLAYLPATAVMFLVSATTPGLAARLGNGALAALGLLITAGGLALLLLTGTGSSWTATLPGMVVALIGVGLYNPASGTIALTALPDRQSGLAAGTFDTFRQAGMALGTAALGAFVPAAALAGHDASSYVDGFHHALLVGVAIALVGGLVAAVTLVLRGPVVDVAALEAAAGS